MAKYKRQKVKRYRRSFYSRGTRIKKGIGIVVLVLAVLGAAWLAAPHVLDWATHTWYTVVKNRDLEAESASRAAASSEAAASSAVQEAASSQPEPEQPKELDGKAITGGSWAAVDVSTLADDAAIRAAAQQLKAQGADYGLVTLKDTGRQHPLRFAGAGCRPEHCRHHRGPGPHRGHLPGRGRDPCGPACSLQGPHLLPHRPQHGHPLTATACGWTPRRTASAWLNP